MCQQLVFHFLLFAAKDNLVNITRTGHIGWILCCRIRLPWQEIPDYRITLQTTQWWYFVHLGPNQNHLQTNETLNQHCGLQATPTFMASNSFLTATYPIPTRTWYRHGSQHTMEWIQNFLLWHHWNGCTIQAVYTTLNQPWVTRTIKCLSKHKKRAVRRARHTKKLEDLIRYKEQKTVQRECRKVYNSYTRTTVSDEQIQEHI